jgi:hypothetical protein
MHPRRVFDYNSIFDEQSPYQRKPKTGEIDCP